MHLTGRNNWYIWFYYSYLRRTASTNLNEQGFNSDAIEACLNHTMRGVYNKAKYEKERIDIMEKWSNYIFSVIYEPNLIFFNQVRGA